MIFDFVETDDVIEWRKYLYSTNVCCPYLSWSWGDYKKLSYYTVKRVLIKDRNTNDVVGLLQLQEKRKLIFKLYVCQGGVNLKKEYQHFYSDVIDQLAHKFLRLNWQDIFLVNYYSLTNDAYTEGLLLQGFIPVINSKMYSYTLDFVDGYSHDKQSKNWRHNLKRGEKIGLKTILGESAETRKDLLDALNIFYSELTLRKGFKGAVEINLIKDLVVNDPDFYIVGVMYLDKIIAVRVGYRINHEMQDFLAASGVEAKNNYANYVALWSLIKTAKDQGVRRFECGGIDPFGNRGVYQFKKGLGGKLSLLGPSWIYSNSDTLKKIAAILLI